jgi:hypothetical protein
MKKRIEFIKKALDVNEVKATIINELIKDIPDDKLANFFAYRLNFVDEKMSVELITKKAIFEYKRLLIQARLKAGEKIFKSITELKKFLQDYYKGKDIANCGEGSGFFEFVVIGMDKEGNLINKNVQNEFGSYLKLTADEEAMFLNWLLKHQDRIGRIDYEVVAKKDEILMQLENKFKEQEIENTQAKLIENKVTALVGNLAQKVRA